MTKIDWTKPLRTKCGSNARFIGELKGRAARFAVAIEFGEGEFVKSFNAFGEESSDYSEEAFSIENIPQFEYLDVTLEEVLRTTENDFVPHGLICRLKVTWDGAKLAGVEVVANDAQT